MSETICPHCGCVGWVHPGPCGFCGHSEWRALRLLREDGHVLPIGRLETPVGRSWARRMFGDDARFWDEGCQMTFVPQGTGWLVRHNPAAANETLLNGRAVSGDVELEDGMVVGVGRESKGIVKTPMSVRLE